jgi:hypothetical protein
MRFSERNENRELDWRVPRGLGVGDGGGLGWVS